MEFLEISEILPFGVDITDSIFRNSMIFVKHMGRYGYGGRAGPQTNQRKYIPRMRNPALGVQYYCCQWMVLDGCPLFHMGFQPTVEFQEGRSWPKPNMSYRDRRRNAVVVVVLVDSVEDAHTDIH